MLSIKEKQRKEIYKEKKGKEIMKDCLTKEERQLLSEKLFMNENCDVADFIKRIDSRLSDKRREYKKFEAQFQDDIVNFKKLSESLDETVELCRLKRMCNAAYEKQKHKIVLVLDSYSCWLNSFLPEEEEEA